MSDTIDRLNAALEGRYRIERELGEGGMATVYLADDLKHERKVALKVLRPELAAVVGADRFLAEIKTTANLQHPHILPLFDSGQADSFLFYVMPYIEGETLRDRIDREKQLPIDEALGIATAVANALQTAHEAGVIHRDIKPGNILLSRGEPLVADFGIALAVGASGGNRLTETGLSVGTPFYMSPEQATGDQMVGPAADTYALACVLYEMLVGEPPYLGNTAQAVLGKIIQGIPVSATAARSSVPANVDAAIRKALEKLPADRFTRAADFAKALADPGFRHGEVATAGARRAGPWKPLAIGMTVAVVALAGVLGGMLLAPEGPLPVTRVAIDFPEGQAPAYRRTFDISADGSVLAYRGPGGEGGGTGQIWARPLEALEATPVRGSEAAGQLFALSPDGREIAVANGASLRVIPLGGGIPRTVAASGVSGDGVRWSADGAWLYFRGEGGGISRVPSAGGEVEVMTSPESAAYQGWPEPLPGGRFVLFEQVDSLGGSSRIMAVDVGSGEVRELTAGTFPRYSQGYLLFTDLTGTTLLAQPLDVDALELTGAAVPIAESLAQPTSGWAYYAVSQTGSLVYTTGSGSGTGEDTELVWVSRSGAQEPLGWSFTRGDANLSWRLSPAGDAVALRSATDGNLDIWVKELPDRPPRRLTISDEAELAPWWTHDGTAVNYIGGDRNVWVALADGTGQPELFLDAGRDIRIGDWTPDGTHLVLRTAAAALGASNQPDRDLYLFRPGVDEDAAPLIATAEFAENNPAVSPDGRWLAYASDETGRYEVWVRPFPDVEAAGFQVSASGGTQPRWARDGSELYYLSPDQDLLAVRYEAAPPRFRVLESEVLFRLPPEVIFTPQGEIYDVGSAEQGFLMARLLGLGSDGGADHVLVLNAFEELRRRTGR